ARRAVFDERVRIARELHDVVAHHVSVMGLQAGGARRVMARQPGRAEEALSSIEASSRQAVAELHRLLGFLRRDADGEDSAPQPDLRQLDTLVADVARGGLHVDVSVEGQPRPLPPTVELSGYRIVQEALTNVVRHAGAAKARVTIRYERRALQLDVVDDGSGAAPDAGNTGAGLGLIGMRERVGLHGGQLSVGPRPDGGFGVCASIPIDEAG
ncbi:MAG: sensor histidine kinase, partial [Acidimicrobiales bacterium]